MVSQFSHFVRAQHAFVSLSGFLSSLVFLLVLAAPAWAQDPSIILINETGTYSITSITTFCTSGTIGVVFTDYISPGLTNPTIYNADNRYVLELSDATGSFTSPTVLATSPYTSALNRQVASGGFTGIIPTSIAPGTGYRVRMATTNPVTHGATFATPITIYAQPSPVTFGGSTLTAGQNSAFTIASTAVCTSGTLVWGRTNGGLATGTGSITVPTDQTGVVSYTAVCQSACGVSAVGSVNITVTNAPPPAIIEVTSCSACSSSGTRSDLQATATGKSFVFTGPGGYVFSTVYRTSGTHQVFARDITQPGLYTLTVTGDDNRQASATLTVQ